MTHSLNQNIFLRINAQIGKRPWLDAWMTFAAKWLIWVLAFVLIFFVWQTIGFSFSALYGSKLANIVLPAGVLSFAFGYGMALLLPRPRPLRELPHIKTLVSTVGTWKSFPSDHTLAATLLSIGMWYAGAPAVLLVPFIFLSVTVAVSRVYVGVHYPRDILGGMLLPFLALFIILGVL